MTRVKVCGLTRAEDVAAAIALDVDFAGFNLWRGSPRCVAPHVARALVAMLPPTILSVGVFVDGREHALSSAEFAGVSWVQIHGTPPGFTNERIARPTIRAVPVDRVLAPADLTGADYWILDKPQEKHGGGGKTFDWPLADALAGHPRVFLAGGLTPENVGDAVRRFRPYAVDVASGIESSPGVKDHAKMKAFVDAVKAAST